MRLSTFLVLFAFGLFVRVDTSESSFVKSGSNLQASGTCMSKNVTLFSEKDEFTINFNVTPGDLKSKMTLKIGGCDASSTLLLIDGGRLLNFGENGTLTFPIVVTVSSSKIKFVGSASGQNPPDLFTTVCAPVFTKVKGGFSTEFELGLSIPTPALTMVLNAVSIYQEPAKEEESTAGFKIALIITGSLVLVLVLSSGSGFGSFRFYQYRKEKQANGEAVLKKPAETKLVETKPTEAKTPETKHEPVVKKVDETKSNKPTATLIPTVKAPSSTFFSDSKLRTAEDELSFHTAELDVDSFSEDSAPTITHPQVQHRFDVIYEEVGSVTISQGQTAGMSMEATSDATIESALYRVPRKLK